MSRFEIIDADTQARFVYCLSRESVVESMVDSVVDSELEVRGAGTIEWFTGWFTQWSPEWLNVTLAPFSQL